MSGNIFREMKKLIVFLLLFLGLVPLVSAGFGQMKLLAVREVGNETYAGSSADLFLETRPGSGRVFLETYPLTKMDTQISTRFAKEIACNYFDLNCKEYDFIYTIKSDTSIVGGPSAGAAMAVLTAAVMKDLKMEKMMTVTGTINSGGVIGPVGGLKAKIEAAAGGNLSVVLIPQGMRQQKEKNETIDLKEYGEENGVLVLEVTDLNEMVFYFTGQKLRGDYTIEVNQEYSVIMKELGNLLCNRTVQLQKELGNYKIEKDEEKGQLINKTTSGKKALEEGNFYSAASFCFGANVQLKSHIYEKENLSKKEVLEKANEIEKNLNNFEENVKARELKTIPDLQTYGVVIERINEGYDNLKQFNETNNTYYLAFAEERLFSAQSWSHFFAMSGQEFKLSDEALEKSCLEKIQEAKERYQYVSLFIFGDLVDLTNEIGKEEEIYRSGDYTYCLIKASQTKAEANTILSSVGLEEDQFDELVESKLTAVERSLARTIAKGAFPILGYSYYQYAQSLKSEDKGLALIYAEYALEMGNLDIYFEEAPKFSGLKLQMEILIFVFGAIFGAAVTGIGFILKRKKKKSKKRK